MNIVDKLREWQRGEREWDQADMVREVLESYEGIRRTWEADHARFLRIQEAYSEALRSNRHD